MGHLVHPSYAMTTLESQIAALQKKIDQLHRERDTARIESAKSYADAFIRKLEADGIPLKIGLQAFQDLAKFSMSARKS